MAEEGQFPTGDEETAKLPPPDLDYEVLRLIGRGGYGEVWLVRDKTGRHLACKVVYRESFEDSRPYEREYEGICKFEPVSRANESQIKILHVGRRDAAGFFYYLMELADDVVTGNQVVLEDYIPKTLGHELRRRGRLPAGECIRIGLSLSAALENLHEHRLIHRDIKPANIIFVNGIPKLADIGLVSNRDMTATFIGTEGYVPPEGPGSASADVYGLGKVLYEMCTGLNRLDYPKLPVDLGEGLERKTLLELNSVVIKACEQDARRRYQTAGELHADLSLLLSGKSVLQRRQSARNQRMLRRIGLAASAVLLMLTGLAVFPKWRRPNDFKAQRADTDAEVGLLPNARINSAELARTFIRAGFEAYGLNDYPRAEKLAESARIAAKNSGDQHLIKQASFLQNEVDRCKREYQPVARLAETLQANPDDRKANLAMGKFMCLVKNDWETGLPMLARGNDPALKSAAEKEINHSGEMNIGDAWWNLAEGVTVGEKSGFRQRARHWYLRAIANTVEPGKSELKKKLADRIKPVAASVGEINIISRVGNAQHIDIYPDELIWKSEGYSLNDQINHVMIGDLKGKTASHVRNTGSTRLFPEGVDLSTARLIIDKKARRRGNAKLEVLLDHVRVDLTDRPRGTSEVDVTITFGEQP